MKIKTNRTSEISKYRHFIICIEVWWEIKLGDIITFLWFQKRAWKSLFGKEGIINDRIVYSKGGYKYLQLELSKLPLSKTKTIDE